MLFNVEEKSSKNILLAKLKRLPVAAWPNFEYKFEDI